MSKKHLIHKHFAAAKLPLASPLWNRTSTTSNNQHQTNSANHNSVGAHWGTSNSEFKCHSIRWEPARWCVHADIYLYPAWVCCTSTYNVFTPAWCPDKMHPQWFNACNAQCSLDSRYTEHSLKAPLCIVHMAAPHQSVAIKWFALTNLPQPGVSKVTDGNSLQCYP